MRDIDSLLKASNIAVREKLEEKSWKPDWKNLGFIEMFLGALDEMDELKTEIWFFSKSPSNNIEIEKELLKKIRREAADVIAYCSMIIEKCDEGIK